MGPRVAGHDRCWATMGWHVERHSPAFHGACLSRGLDLERWSEDPIEKKHWARHPHPIRRPKIGGTAIVTSGYRERSGRKERAVKDNFTGRTETIGGTVFVPCTTGGRLRDLHAGQGGQAAQLEHWRTTGLGL